MHPVARIFQQGGQSEGAKQSREIFESLCIKMAFLHMSWIGESYVMCSGFRPIQYLKKKKSLINGGGGGMAPLCPSPPPLATPVMRGYILTYFHKLGAHFVHIFGVHSYI